MKIYKKIFLPKWQRWFLIPLFVGMWVLFTYQEFFDPNNVDKMGRGGYFFMSALFLGIAAMMWLMTAGKLSAYIIEETREEDEKTNKP